jgi:hypothetical protein
MNGVTAVSHGSSVPLSQEELDALQEKIKKLAIDVRTRLPDEVRNKELGVSKTFKSISFDIESLQGKTIEGWIIDLDKTGFTDYGREKELPTYILKADLPLLLEYAGPVSMTLREALKFVVRMINTYKNSFDGLSALHGSVIGSLMHMEYITTTDLYPVLTSESAGHYLSYLTFILLILKEHKHILDCWKYHLLNIQLPNSPQKM